MLIRISLMVAIAGALAVAGFNSIEVNRKITATIAERNQLRADRDAAVSSVTAARKTGAETKARLDQTAADLAAARVERDQAVAAVQEQADIVRKIEHERDTTSNELAAWKAFGMSVDQIRPALASGRHATAELDALRARNKVMLEENQRLKTRLANIITPDAFSLPEGLKGEVLVSDPRFDFVVLDIGWRQGALENGQMLVQRKGKLVGKLRIQRVEADRSIANVIPGWKLAAVMEGDQVFY